MEADSPGADRDPSEAPELLWNPDETLFIHHGPQIVAVADYAKPAILQNSKRRPIERMRRSDPYLGINPLGAEPAQPLLNLFLLGCAGQASKFALFIDPNDAWRGRHV